MTERHRDDDIRESSMMTQVVIMTCIFFSLWLATGFAAIKFAG